MLERLTAQFGVVAIVSGRPVAFLVARLGIGPSLARLGVYGQYGLEHRAPDGSIVCDPLVDDYAGTVAEAIREAHAAAPPGALVEEKGLALTLHWRNAPDVAPRAIELADEIAARHGLAIRQGKRAIELVLPVANDKGSVVVSLLAGCSAGCVLGDDVGDIPAFRAVDVLAHTQQLRRRAGRGDEPGGPRGPRRRRGLRRRGTPRCARVPRGAGQPGVIGGPPRQLTVRSRGSPP